QLLAIETVDGEPGRGILGGGDFVNGVAGDTVLGAEQRDQLNSGGLREDLYCGASLKIHAGVIGDEADVFATERGEFLGFEDVEARLNPANVAPLGFRVLLSCDSEVRQEHSG